MKIILSIIFYDICWVQSLLVRHVFYSYCFQVPEGDAAITMATRSPEKYVLKPQREGGGLYMHISVKPFFKKKVNINLQQTWFSFFLAAIFVIC